MSSLSITKPNALPWLLVSAIVIALDQWTKWLVLQKLTPYMPHVVVPHVLNWTLAFNTGAALPLALIVGGALGNLIDRLLRGQVTDFIQVYWHQWSWPAFNVADSAICVGAIALIVTGLFVRAPQRDN